MSWYNSIRSRLELGWLIFTLTYLKARKKTVKIFIQAIKKPDCKCFQFALVIKLKGVYGFFHPGHLLLWNFTACFAKKTNQNE